MSEQLIDIVYAILSLITLVSCVYALCCALRKAAGGKQ